MKYCNKCKELKYENEFGKRAASSDGLQYKCKDCKSAYQKENRKHITESHNEWQKKRYHSDIIILE